MRSWYMGVDRVLLAALLLLLLQGRAAAVPATLDAAQVAPGVIVLGVATPVRFFISVNDPDLLPGGLNLVRLDATGRPTTVLARFVDDGTGPDKTAGDKVFTATVVLTGSTEGFVEYAASAAFKGRLVRMLSMPVKVLVSKTPSAAASFATISEDRLKFVDSAGGVSLVVDLPNSESVPAQGGWQGIVSDARMSEFGECAIVFSERKSIGPGAQETVEPDLESASVDLYCGGQKLWQKTPAAGMGFFREQLTQLISARGSRVLLVEVPVGAEGAPLKIRVVDQGANETFVVEQELYDPISAGISSNGRYVYVQARQGSGIRVIRFFDSVSGAPFEFPYDPSTYKALEVLENAQGSFSVIADGAVAFSMPTP